MSNEPVLPLAGQISYMERERQYHLAANRLGEQLMVEAILKSLRDREQLVTALHQANAQLTLAAECIEMQRYDEALLHCNALPRQRLSALSTSRGES